MFTNVEKNFLRMFNFEHIKLNQKQFDQLAKLLLHYKPCYASSKFDAGKIKVELNLPLKATAVFKKQRATCIAKQLQELDLLEILTHFDMIAPTDSPPIRFSNNRVHIY